MEELKLETVTVHLRGEEEPNPEEQAPGAKLLKLKQALQAKIRQKREEEIKRKQEIHAMDNEQDFGIAISGSMFSILVSMKKLTVNDLDVCRCR